MKGSSMRTKTRLAFCAAGCLIAAVVSANALQQFQVSEGGAPLGNAAALTASCSAEITADRAIMSGAMTGEGLKAVDINARLDKQAEALRALATRRAATVTFGDRIRIARSLSTSSRLPVPDTSGNQEAPLLVLQPVRIEVPVDANLDSLLDEALLTGVDRLGDWSFSPVKDPSVSIDFRPAPGTAASFVHYRVLDARGALERIHQACRRVAFQRWCDDHAAGDAACVGAFEVIGPRLPTRQLVLGDPAQSPLLIDFETIQNNVPLSYPWDAADLEQLARLTTRTSHFIGRIVIVMPGTAR